MTDQSLSPLIRLIDDEPQVLDSLSFMLECEGYRVKTYGSARAFLVDDAPSEPGCIIADVRMPVMSGIELFNALLERQYPVPLLFLSGHGDIEMAVQAVLKGAVDFITKPVDPAKLLPAVSRAIERDRRQRRGNEPPLDAKERWSKLTEREAEVVRTLIHGLMNREAAEALGISVRTVELHRMRAFRKLGVRTPAEAALIAEAAEGN